MDKPVLRISHASHALALAALAAGIAAAFGALAGHPGSQAVRVGRDQVRLDIVLQGGCGRIVSVAPGGVADPASVAVVVDRPEICVPQGDAASRARLIGLPAHVKTLKVTTLAADGTRLGTQDIAVD